MALRHDTMAPPQLLRHPSLSFTPGTWNPVLGLWHISHYICAGASEPVIVAEPLRHRGAVTILTAFTGAKRRCWRYVTLSLPRIAERCIFYMDDVSLRDTFFLLPSLSANTACSRYISFVASILLTYIWHHQLIPS